MGTKLTEFDLPLGAGNGTCKVQIYLLEIPNSSIYTLSNPNSFAIGIEATFMEIQGMEYLGGKGIVGNQQRFEIGPGGVQAFLLRGIQPGPQEAQSFRISSVKGTKIQSAEDPRILKVFEALTLTAFNPEICLIESVPQLHIANLYDENFEKVQIKDK